MEEETLDIEKIIEQWFAENIIGTQVTMITDIYNVVYRAKEELKKQLKEVL